MKFIFVFIFIILSGCDKYYLNIKKEKIDTSFLASNFVKTPDPLSDKIKNGQKLILEWKIPKKDLQKNLFISLKIIFKDYSKETVYFPIKTTIGYSVYCILNDDYINRGGLLTYKAEICDKRGKVFKSVEQHLWVNLILTQVAT